MQVLGYGQIVGAISEDVADNGLKTWGITVHGRYPEAADGSPAVGAAPLQAFEAGTNQGLGVDTSITTQSGIVAIQFQSA
jgi:hypothetical protein